MRAKEIPLSEITLRKYERPENLKRRQLVTKTCLSMGLLQPGDSRDVIVDVLQVLLERKNLNSKQIEEHVIKNRKKHKIVLAGIAPSNLRRQIKRLRDVFLIEKIGNRYRIAENEKFVNIYKDKIEQYLLKSISDRVVDYLAAVDQEFLVRKR